MEQRSVSVIITTCRRGQAILKRAIDSVFTQDYPFLEVIVVNDSPSFEQRPAIDTLIGRYGAKMRYFVNERNLGANASRNLAVAASCGDYIAFLDDDDVWRPNKLSESLRHFSGDVGLVYSDILMTDGKKARYIRKKDVPREKQAALILGKNFVGGFSSVVLKKEIFAAAGGLDETFPSSQDMDLWIRMAELCGFYHVGMDLNIYYVSQDAISLNIDKKIAGVNDLFAKYKEKYRAHPEMKRLRFNSEIAMYLRHGWRKRAMEVYRAAYGGSRSAYCKNYGCVIRGNIKHAICKVIKIL